MIITATGFLFAELYQFLDIKHRKEINDIFDKAKKMERNQIIRAVNYCEMNREHIKKQAIEEVKTIGEIYYYKMIKDGN